MAGPKICRPTMKLPTFNWEADDKYNKLYKNLQVRVNNFLTIDNTPQTDQLAMVKIWLGSKGLPFMESLQIQKKIHAAHWKDYSKY